MILTINKVRLNKFFSNFIFLILILCLNSCNDNKFEGLANNSPLIIGVSADYPPFEFIQNGEFKGLDIELANLIANHLDQKIKFKDLTYNNLFLALNSGQIDMAISTITFTEERNQHFDLSIPYYFTDFAVVFRKSDPINKVADLYLKKIGVQLGSTMEIWAKSLKNINLVSMDLNLQLIEALNSKHLDVVVIEYAQAREFCKHNPGLGYTTISKSKNGYVVALKKGSNLLPKVNAALTKIKQDREFEKLQHKWLEIAFEMEVHDAN